MIINEMWEGIKNQEWWLKIGELRQKDLEHLCSTCGSISIHSRALLLLGFGKEACLGNQCHSIDMNPEMFTLLTVNSAVISFELLSS